MCQKCISCCHFFVFFSKCLRNCGRCLVLLYIVKTWMNGSRYRRKIHVFPSFCSPNCSSTCIYTILLIISYPEPCFNLHVLWSQYDKHTHNVPVDLCKFYLAFFFFFSLNYRIIFRQRHLWWEFVSAQWWSRHFYGLRREGK